jgi:hypothetical protein
MRFMMLRMLSSSSLSAFSPVPAVHSPGQTNGVQRARSTGTPSTGAQTAKPPIPASPRSGGGDPPPRNLPRGSLLDLSA